MRRFGLLVAALASVCSNLALANQEPAPKIVVPIKDATASTLTDEQVVASLVAGVNYLLKQQKDGLWEATPAKHNGQVMEGGMTAFCTYTLLHVGRSLKDPRLTPRSPEIATALRYLKSLDSDWTYVKSYQLAALSMLPGDQEHKQLLAKIATPMVRELAAGTGFGYHLASPGKPADKLWDNSNTQIALLATWAVDEAGVEIPVRFWRHQDNLWRRSQSKDGGWSYTLGAYPGIPKFFNESYPQMTAAGVASMYILREKMAGPPELARRPDPSIAAGLAWLDKNYDPQKQATPSHGYYLYCLERVGLAAGRKHFAGHDWYRASAAQLLGRQNPNGSWNAQDRFHEMDNPMVPTCFGLIFLARGRNPVLFNKLEYPGNTWDARPNDLSHLTQWMEHGFERAINWQSVSLASKPEDWLDAPLLLISGSANPRFDDAAINKLRDFVLTGGIIFSTADGSRAEFTDAVRTTMTKLGNRLYEPRELPNDHPVFSAWAKVKTPPRLIGLSNGVRELWVHSPVDMGATWQKRGFATKEHWDIPANLAFYALGGPGDLNPRLRTTATKPARGDAKKTIPIARLDYAGNWDPEPNAWPRFAQRLRAAASVEPTFTTATIAALDATKFRIAVLTGTSAFSLSDDALKGLKTYLAAGGSLLIDNASGGREFDESARRLITSLDVGKLVPVLNDDALLSGTVEATLKIDSVDYRKAAVLRDGRREGPELLAIKNGERCVVVYSPYAITPGLLGTNTMGIVGYEPPSAEMLARNIVLNLASDRK